MHAGKLKGIQEIEQVTPAEMTKTKGKTEASLPKGSRSNKEQRAKRTDSK